MLAGALVVPLTGCDLLPKQAPAQPAPPTADELLVDRVTAALRAARDVAAAAPHGQSVAALHDAHLTALGAPTAASSTAASSTAASPSATPPPGDLRATEVALQTTLTRAANHATDGDLARLLASIAASVAQQVTVLTGSGAAR
jgi:hypothetical protein